MRVQSSNQTETKHYSVTTLTHFENGDSSTQTFGVEAPYPAVALIKGYEDARRYAQSSHPGQDRHIVVHVEKPAVKVGDVVQKAQTVSEFLQKYRCVEPRDFFFEVRFDRMVIYQGRVKAYDRAHADTLVRVYIHDREGNYASYSDADIYDERPALSQNPYFNLFKP